MIKQVLIPLAAVIFFIIVIGLLSKNSLPFSDKIFQAVSPKSTHSEKSLTIGVKTIGVEIANTNSLRTKGLSGRNTLPQNSGMLFVFDSKKTTPGFWMKDMLIPLDIIWIRDGQVERIDKNIPAPAPHTPDNKLSAYYPDRPVDYVLEVNAGFSQKNGIKVGDAVTLPTDL